MPSALLRTRSTVMSGVSWPLISQRHRHRRADACAHPPPTRRRSRAARCRWSCPSPPAVQATSPAASWRRHDRRARPDRRRGESGRRRRHGRLAARVARRRRTARIRARQQRHAQLEPVALQDATLRHDQGLHAAWACGRVAARHHRAEGSAGQHAAGVHRLREGEPGQDPVRLGGRRLRLARELHPAQRHARRERHPRAVSRPRAGDDRT